MDLLFLEEFVVSPEFCFMFAGAVFDDPAYKKALGTCHLHPKHKYQHNKNNSLAD